MNIKKIIASSVLGALTLSALPVAAAFPDVPDSAYYSEAVQETQKLGYFTGDHRGNFNPENQITRAEFTVLMCRFSGENHHEALEEGAFSDLSPDHWSAGYVKAAMENGILQGFEDGTFRPNEPVTGEQAVKMVVCALGFKDEAEELGAYPEGYTWVAEEKGLVQTEVTADGFLRGDSAVLIYNAVKLLAEEEAPEPEEAPEKDDAVSKPGGGGGGSSRPSKPDKDEPEEETPEENIPEEDIPENEIPDGGITDEEIPEVNTPGELPEAPEEETGKIPFGEGLSLKQEEPDSCTASALTTLLRRLYYTNGNDYSHITETALKNNENVWLPEVGLYNEIEFEGFKILKKYFDAETDKVEFFKAQLAVHPEGIIIYDTGLWHAVVLTDYRDGVFYATDPATGWYTPLSEVFTMSGETQEDKLREVDYIWILEK